MKIHAAYRGESVHVKMEVGAAWIPIVFITVHNTKQWLFCVAGKGQDK